MMRFGKIDNVLLLGGSPLLARLATRLKENQRYSVTCFSCQRQLGEIMNAKGETLEDLLKEDGIPYYRSEDICKDEAFLSGITDTTLALGFGEVWTFDKKTIDLFQGRLLDFMGIPLPRYRGGAHYSWLILKGEKAWGCHLQMINEDMVQGEFDSGEIVKSKHYSFPESAKVPQDYFDSAVIEELAFLEEFLGEVEGGKDFPLTTLDEEQSIFFPRLYTREHGWIDWTWKARDIESFIAAFDEPYAGASTYAGEQRVFLKDCSYQDGDGSFHPFQAGLIYRKCNGALYVAVGDGTIVIQKVRDETGAGIMDAIKVGQRFSTPAEVLEKSRHYRAVYDQQGIAG